MDSFQDVTVGGVEYRIGVFTPMVGGLVMLQLRQMLSDENIYASVMRNCLDVLAVLKEKNGDKFPFKLYSKEKNRWIEPEIKNPATLNELMMKVTSFNFDPFIEPSSDQNDTGSSQPTPPPTSQTA